MSAPSGIEQFDALATLAFARLYEAFPNPIDLDGKELGTTYCESWESQSASDEMNAAITNTGRNTLDWLVEEGFIRFEEDQRVLAGGPSHPEARLTLRGLTALRAVPQSVSDGPKGSKSFGEQALDAAGKGTKLAIGEISKSVIAGVVTAFFRANGWGG